MERALPYQGALLPCLASSDKIARQGDVTRLLERWQAGDESALPELTPLIDAELHALARHYMRGERTDTLQPTALVNEAPARRLRRRSISRAM